MLPQPLAPAPGRFLHLILDEKFIDAAQGIFEEACPAAHDYLVVGPPVPLRRIRTFTPSRLTLEAALERRFLSHLPRYAAVFVHYLDDAARLIVAESPRATRFIWLGWGADYYHLIHTREELLLPRTRGLVSGTTMPVQPNKPGPTLQMLAGLARATLQPLAAARRYRLRRTSRRVGPNAPGEGGLINRFRGIAMPIREDFSAVCARHPELRAPYVDWNYWTEGFRADAAPGPTDNNILLGNSATEANNHLDALEYLRDILPPDRKVICPLSYGDQRYGDAIEEAGHRLLGNRFIPLRGYMDTGAYADVVASCSIVVMNHVRQQALGNIIMALCAGARVFLDERNPINAAMQRIGVDVHLLGELQDFLDRGEPAVPEQELDERRRRIEDQYGRPSILHRTRGLLERLSGAP